MRILHIGNDITNLTDAVTVATSTKTRERVVYVTEKNTAVLTCLTRRGDGDDPKRTKKPHGQRWGWVYQERPETGAKFVEDSPSKCITRAAAQGNVLIVVPKLILTEAAHGNLRDLTQKEKVLRKHFREQTKELITAAQDSLRDAIREQRTKWRAAGRHDLVQKHKIWFKGRMGAFGASSVDELDYADCLKMALNMATEFDPAKYYVEIPARQCGKSAALGDTLRSTPAFDTHPTHGDGPDKEFCGYIDATPRWTSLVQTLAMMAANGNEDSMEELQRMASTADAYNAMRKELRADSAEALEALKRLFCHEHGNPDVAKVWAFLEGGAS